MGLRRGLSPGQGVLMASGEVLLGADHLSKHYKNVVALNDVSFTISDGITGILGETAPARARPSRFSWA